MVVQQQQKSQPYYLRKYKENQSSSPVVLAFSSSSSSRASSICSSQSNTPSPSPLLDSNNNRNNSKQQKTTSMMIHLCFDEPRSQNTTLVNSLTPLNSIEPKVKSKTVQIITNSITTRSKLRRQMAINSNTNSKAISSPIQINKSTFTHKTLSSELSDEEDMTNKLIKKETF